MSSPGNSAEHYLMLDSASFTPPDPEAIAVMDSILASSQANPLGRHGPGKEAARLLQAGRRSVARTLGAEPHNIIFTSGGTESANLGVKGIALARLRALQQALNAFPAGGSRTHTSLDDAAYPGDATYPGEAARAGAPSTLTTPYAGSSSDGLAQFNGSQTSVTPRVLVSAIEHPSVLESARWLSTWFDVEVVTLPVDSYGHVNLDTLEQYLIAGELKAGRQSASAPKSTANSPNLSTTPIPEPTITTTPAPKTNVAAASTTPTNSTLLVAVSAASSEVGTVQPISEIARICHNHGVPVYVDAVQAAGLIPVSLQDWGVDALGVSGHKVGSPTAVGALALREGTQIEALLSGGGQERGLRSGTQDVATALGFAVALSNSAAKLASPLPAQLASSRERLIQAICQAAPSAQLTGHPTDRLPGHASFVFPGVTGEALLVDLDAHGIACSSGSACDVLRSEPPQALLAMGYARSTAESAVRFSFRTSLDDAQIHRVAEAVRESTERLLAGKH